MYYNSQCFLVCVSLGSLSCLPCLILFITFFMISPSLFVLCFTSVCSLISLVIADDGAITISIFVQSGVMTCLGGIIVELTQVKVCLLDGNVSKGPHPD